MSTAPGDVLWQPRDPNNSRLGAYVQWLADTRGERFDDYSELHRWSTSRLDDFWLSVWDYFELSGPRPSRALEEEVMPGTNWFAGARVNYAREMIPRASDQCLVSVDENQDVSVVHKQELIDQVGAWSATLHELGVNIGDRVAGYVSNNREAVVALLATTAIGAIWTSCAPEFGAQGAVERMAQLDPKVLIAVNGYTFGGQFYDRSADLDVMPRHVGRDRAMTRSDL